MTEEELKRVDTRIGQRLRQIRLLRGLRQQDIASRIGLTYQQVQKYERGENRISASRLVQLSTVLEVHPGTFFDELPFFKETPFPVLDQNHLALIEYYNQISEPMQRTSLDILRELTRQHHDR